MQERCRFISLGVFRQHASNARSLRVSPIVSVAGITRSAESGAVIAHADVSRRVVMLSRLMQKWRSARARARFCSRVDLDQERIRRLTAMVATHSERSWAIGVWSGLFWRRMGISTRRDRVEKQADKNVQTSY